MFFKNALQHPVRIHYLLRLFIFWMIVFFLFRIVLIAFNVNTVFESGFLPAAYSLMAGIRLDLSTFAYLTLPSFLLWAINQFLKSKFIAYVNDVYNIGLLFLTSLLAVSNIKMHHEWGTLLNVGVFDYLAHPKVVVSFISTTQLILLLIFLILYFSFTVFLYRKLVKNFATANWKIAYKALLIVMVLVTLPILARGGFQLAPINESSAYFSETPFYNHVAINPIWYFIHSYLDRNSSGNSFLFMPPEEAEERNNKLFAKSTVPGESILNTFRPNIIIIVLESWTADIIQSLGGLENVTPNFDTLRKEGVLFTQIYAAGARTEHGLISVLSGYPPPPQISIITIPSKSEKLKSINTILASDGYTSSFFYGGEIGFVNMKSYLITSHFNSITDKSSFEESQLNSKWGAHDQYVFDKQLHDLKNMKEPFLSVLLTLSSHEPFEVPMETPFNGHDESEKFKKAAYYSDHCLGEYFKNAKKERWFDNTLFILVADHGHRLPKNTDIDQPESKRIPLLFFGNVLKENVRGTTIDKTGNQNDIAATLLSQLNKDYSVFPRSKDLLNPTTKEFAYYTNSDVLGWITPQQSFIYFYATQQLLNSSDALTTSPVNDSLVLDAKAYLQTHYQQYLKF